MEFDVSTLIFEVINFLILLWLLKRFLYQPVLSVIEKRRQQIESELAQAARQEGDAQALKQQYERRLLDWDDEKSLAKDVLAQEINAERIKRIQQLDSEQAQLQKKNIIHLQQQQSAWRSQAEAEALQLGGAFASRLLTSLTCAELDVRLLQLFIEQLMNLPEEALSELSAVELSKVQVTSAHVLDDVHKESIRQALERKLGLINAQWLFSEDESLIAGLRVSVAGWNMGANLQDELRFFNQAGLMHE